jgi:hypothetical protein
MGEAPVKLAVQINADRAALKNFDMWLHSSALAAD